MSEPQRQVRVSSYTTRDGTSVRGYTQRRDAASEDDARRQWQTKRWQAAAAGMSVLIILAEVLVGVSEIAFAMTLVFLLGLNYLINMLTSPRPKAATSRKRTVTRRHVVRRRGPARKTVRRR